MFSQYGLTNDIQSVKRKIKIWQELVNEHKYFEPKGHNHKYKGILLSQCWLTQSKWVFAPQIKMTRNDILFLNLCISFHTADGHFPAVTSQGSLKRLHIWSISHYILTSSVSDPQQCSGPVLSALWKSQLLFHSLGWWGRLQDQKRKIAGVDDLLVPKSTF